MPISIADIAPVGSLIWNDVPDKAPMMIPVIIAVTSPAAA